jgi:hypothetical protein
MGQSPQLRCRRQRLEGIGRPTWFLRAVVVGELLAGERVGEALGDFRQHRRVPRLPLGDDSVVDSLVALLKIGALERILDHVEQEGVVEDFQKLVVALPYFPLWRQNSFRSTATALPVSVGSKFMPSGG